MVLRKERRHEDEVRRKQAAHPPWRELLDEWAVPRPVRFMKPWIASFVRWEQREHAGTFVQGLLSDLAHKPKVGRGVNTELIAYRFGQERMPLQWFHGTSDWDHEPLREELARQTREQLGEQERVIVFDPSAFLKSGRESVGVARPWRGRPATADLTTGQGRELPGGGLSGMRLE